MRNCRLLQNWPQKRRKPYMLHTERNYCVASQAKLFVFISSCSCKFLVLKKYEKFTNINIVFKLKVEEFEMTDKIDTVFILNQCGTKNFFSAKN